MSWRGIKLSGGLISKYPTTFTADSKYFFSPCGPDIKMYSVTTGEQTRLLQGHTNTCVGTAINPENPLQLYTFSLDCTLRVWDYNDAILLNTIKFDFPVYLFAFNPRHKHIVYLATVALKEGKSGNQTSTEPISLKEAAKSDRHHAVILSYNLKTKETEELFTMRYCQSLTVAPYGEYLFALSSNHFLVYDVESKKIKKYTHKTGLTCIAIHPKQQFVVTGNAVGELIYWYLFGRNSTTGKTQLEEQALTTSSHWHSQPVGAVAFDSEGAHLYSGGKEMVLVVWQLETGHKDFLPRLGAKLRGIVISPDQTLIALRTSDNSIKLINARSRHLETSVEGVTTYMKRKVKTGLIVEPRGHNFAFNATDGQLQIYNALEDRNITKLQVGPPNPVKDFMNFRIPESVVEHAAFSKNGDWLVTVERRVDGKTPTLKFWSYDTRAQQYDLNTQVNSPHASKISAVVYHPETDLCVTVSLDGKFKLWVVVERTETPEHSNIPAGLPEVCWACKSVGFFRDLPAKSAAFSADGSVLAIAYQNIVTLWNPFTNTLLNTLTYPPAFEHIRQVAFLATSPYLIACSKTTLYVWNLLTARIAWSVSLRVKQLAVDPNSSRFAIYSPKNRPQSSELEDLKKVNGHLLIWDVSNPKPLVSWYICGGPAKGIAFMPPSPATQLRASRISPGAQASSALVYLNLANEFIVLEEQLVPSSGLLDSANSSSRLDGAATTTSPAPMISTPETPSNKSKRKEKEKEKALTSSTSSAELDSSSTSITTQLREGFYKQMNSKQLLEGPSVFRQMFGNPEALLALPGQSAEAQNDEMAVDGSENWDEEDETQPEVKPIAMLPKVTSSGALIKNQGASGSSGGSGVWNAQATKKLKELFDAPSHALPPTSALFSGFVEALMQKLPVVQQEESKANTEETKPKSESKPKPKTSGDTELFSEAKLLEKESGQHIAFLADFFAGK